MKGAGIQMMPRTTLGNLLAKWDKRYFVLEGSILYYYKALKDRNKRCEAGLVHIDGALIDDVLTTGGEHSFGIFT